MIITEKQKEFIKYATHRYNLKIGARRCGKTYLDILYTIPSRLIEGKRKRRLKYHIRSIKRDNRKKCFKSS